MSIDIRKYLKKITAIPNDFIDEMFDLYNEKTTQVDFVVDLYNIAKWLDVSRKELVRTLIRTYKKNIDYISHTINMHRTSGGNNNKQYLVTPDCFKRICMLSKSKKADLVRTYFIELESIIIKYRTQLIDGLQNDIDKIEKASTIEPKVGYIYVIRASDKMDNIYKLGRSKDLKSRLSTYQTGKLENIDVEFVYKTDNLIEVENCVKALVRTRKLKKYKEIYNIDLSILKSLIEDCSRLSIKAVYKGKKNNNTGKLYTALFTENIQ